MKCSLASRCHHLLKTFYAGVEGWLDLQLPDGTVVWTSPTGHIYRYAGSRCRDGSEPVPPSAMHASWPNGTSTRNDSPHNHRRISNLTVGVRMALWHWT